MTDKLHCPCVYSKKRRGKALNDYERSIYNRWATMIGRCENPRREERIFEDMERDLSQHKNGAVYLHIPSKKKIV